MRLELVSKSGAQLDSLSSTLPGAVRLPLAPGPGLADLLVLAQIDDAPYLFSLEAEDLIMAVSITTAGEVLWSIGPAGGG